MLDAKTVLDSSADINEYIKKDVRIAPLKIIAGNKEYIDDKNLDSAKMVEELQNYKGKSSTACPSPEDWIKNFENKKYVFCITITKHLSGSYNTAKIAKLDYEQKFPERKVMVIDSLSCGGEMGLIAEKLIELIESNYTFEEIETEIYK